MFPLARFDGLGGRIRRCVCRFLEALCSQILALDRHCDRHGSGCRRAVSRVAHQRSLNRVTSFDLSGWLAISYIGVAGGALSFFLYAWALGRASPTTIMILLPLNPIAALVAGSLWLGEPMGVGISVWAGSRDCRSSSGCRAQPRHAACMAIMERESKMKLLLLSNINMRPLVGQLAPWDVACGSYNSMLADLATIDVRRSGAGHLTCHLHV